MDSTTLRIDPTKCVKLGVEHHQRGTQATRIELIMRGLSSLYEVVDANL